jgi:hypothetical protein
LKLPTSLEEIDLLDFDILRTGKSEEAKTYMADGTPVVTNETLTEDGATPRVDLPDVDATTTRYFWTVVRVGIRFSTSGAVEYYDAEVPQDACEEGRVGTFAKVSRPAVTGSGSPYVAGLSPKGRLLASVGHSAVVYSTPLVTWRPVMGASAYRIEWSKTRYPWRGSGGLVTRSTSAVLQLKPGRWYYRVRGLNPVQVGTSAMTWSQPVAVRVVRPTFRISGG